MKKYLFLLGLPLIFCGRTDAQTYDTNNPVVQTFVGSGFYGHYDGQGTQTMFYQPSSIVVDSSGNFFVADNANYRIRKVTPGGVVTTFVGGGNSSVPGYGTNVSLHNYFFNGMAIDRSNVLWVAVSYQSSLLRIASDGLVQPIILAGVSSPGGICVDSKNNVYVSDLSSHKIFRLLTNGVFEVFAGSGNPGSIDGNGVFNSFNGPSALAVDAADNIYVWDAYNYLLRKINQDRDVITIAGQINTSQNGDGVGTNATFGGVVGMAFDTAGNLLLSSTVSSYSSSGSAIRRFAANGTVTTIAGHFTETGFFNGPGEDARFSGASGICISQGNIFVAESINQRIRRISFGSAPLPVSGPNLVLNSYPGLKITGNIGRTYRIESSTNMSNWNSEETIVLNHSPYLWIDENGIAENKFYRAFLLP